MTDPQIGRPVHTLSQLAAGAANDRPVYLLGQIGVWQPFTAPAGPHTGHTLVLRKAKHGTVRSTGVMQCVPCRTRWTFSELAVPADDPWRHRG